MMVRQWNELRESHREGGNKEVRGSTRVGRGFIDNDFLERRFTSFPLGMNSSVFPPPFPLAPHFPVWAGMGPFEPAMRLSRKEVPTVNTEGGVPRKLTNKETL